LVNILSNT